MSSSALMDVECELGEDQSYLIRQEKMSAPKLFVPMEKTKEYTERTYYTVKNITEESRNLVGPSEFWSELALHFASENSK